MLSIRALLFSWAVLAMAQPPAVIDRVAVSLGRQVITLSAVRRQLRMEALASGKPVDDTPAGRRAAAGRLIDQAIFGREIELGGFAPPALAEADAQIDGYLKQRGVTRSALAAEVARLGFTDDEFRHSIQWRLHVERFIDFRFAAGTQVTADEIEAYYRDEFLSQWKGAGAAPELDAVRSSIERILSTRKTDAAMQQWLDRQRATLRPRLFDAALDHPEAQP